MYNYMTPLSGMTIDANHDRSAAGFDWHLQAENLLPLHVMLPAAFACRTFEAEGHDMQSLVFNFLDELLFVFSTEFFTCKQLTVTELDTDSWKVKAEGYPLLLHLCLLIHALKSTEQGFCSTAGVSNSNQAPLGADCFHACTSMQALVIVLACAAFDQSCILYAGGVTFLTGRSMSLVQRSKPSRTAPCKSTRPRMTQSCLLLLTFDVS